MRLGRLCRFVLLAAAGGVVFQTTSCASTFLSSLSTALSDTVADNLDTQLTTIMNQLLGTSV